MAATASLARIFGSDDDSISLAPIGTLLPTGLGALAGAFEDVGWLGQDGITETFTGSPSDIRGHQGAGVVRKRIDTPGTQFSFIALESKKQTQELRYHEKSSTVSAGVRSVTRSSGQRVSARACVIDLYDADYTTVRERFVIPRLEITPNGDRTYVNSDIAGYPFLGEIIGDYEHYSTDEASVPDVGGKTVWTVTVEGEPTGGTYTLLVNGVPTAPIAYNATASNVATAINALSGVTGLAGVTGTSTISLTFPSKAVLTVTHDLTGGTNPGVTVA